MQKPSTTTNIQDRQQGFKAYGAPEAIPTYDICPNDINPNDNPIVLKFAVIQPLTTIYY